MQVKIQRKKLRKIILILILFFLFLVILPGCAGAPATEEPAAPAEPAAPEAPTEPVEPSEGLPVQYGQDSRTEPFQHTDSKLKEMAASVAIFVHKDQVLFSGDTVTLEGHTLDEMSEMGWLVRDVTVPMCPDELFTAQVAPGFCTGFLVKEDILVSAGHCLEKTACSDIRIVFGFQMESNDSLAPLSQEDVFKCVDVLAQVSPNQGNQYLDYAIIQLDRPTGRAGLEYSTEDHLTALDKIAVLGYPSGLPLKIASNAYVMRNNVNDSLFITNLDAFGSNSGSPVISVETYQVEGILVRGVQDYVLSDNGACVQVNRCPETGDVNCAGENATKMALLAGPISEIVAGKPGGLNCLPSLLLGLLLMAMLRLTRV